MRLKSIGIANFKAYGPTVQTIPIRPLTLIFGANSSGKSSLLHSLLWLNHASTRRDADVYEPVASEKTVHLGGFDSCVHQSSKGKPVKIYLELDQLEISVEEQKMFRSPSSVKIGLGISRRNEGETPSILAWELSIDDQQLMRGKGYGPNVAPDAHEVNWKHPFLQMSGTDDAWKNQILQDFKTGGIGPGTYSLECHGVIPSRMFLDVMEILPLDDAYEKMGPLDKESSGYFGVLAKQQFINKLRYRMPSILSKFLGDLIEVIEGLTYLPPLRSVPDRFENLRTCSNPSWRALSHGEDIVNSVNKALQTLDIPHRLEVRKLIPAQDQVDASDYFLQLRLLDRKDSAIVDLQDVGVGTGQVLPLVIESIVNRNRLIVIEQPEVHIHPRLQAALGDIFIESAVKNRNTLLVETHSEHLILRILRRIRETTRRVLPPDVVGISPDDVAVLYVEPGNEGASVREIRIDPHGRFIDDWPDGFFEERFNEVF